MGTTFVPQMQETDMKSFHNTLLQVTTLYVSNNFSTGPADPEHPAKIAYLFIWKYNANGQSYKYASSTEAVMMPILCCITLWSVQFLCLFVI